MYIQVLNSFAGVNVVDIINTKMMLLNTLRDVLMIDWVLSVFLNNVYMSKHILRSCTTLLKRDTRKVNFDFYKIKPLKY